MTIIDTRRAAKIHFENLSKENVAKYQKFGTTYDVTDSKKLFDKSEAEPKELGSRFHSSKPPYKQLRRSPEISALYNKDGSVDWSSYKVSKDADSTPDMGRAAKDQPDVHSHGEVGLLVLDKYSGIFAKLSPEPSSIDFNTRAGNGKSVFDVIVHKYGMTFFRGHGDSFIKTWHQLKK